MADLEHLLADYEAKLAEVQRKAEQVTDGLNAVEATERSPDGRVTVTVNASGNVVALQLAPGNRHGAELAQTIMHTMRRAQSKLADAVQNRLPTTVGVAIMDELTAQYRDRYPAPPPEPTQGPRRILRLGAETEPGAAEHQPRRRRGEPQGDIDYSDRGLLR